MARSIRVATSANKRALPRACKTGADCPAWPIGQTGQGDCCFWPDQFVTVPPTRCGGESGAYNTSRLQHLDFSIQRGARNARSITVTSTVDSSSNSGCAGVAGLISPSAYRAGRNAASASSSAGEEIEEVVVTGFRRSLSDSTDAKRESVGFADSMFAEDIGKFPDTNLAESFNRIPGITITREITGEGLNVAIRGLNTNFTRVLLNNAPVAIASTGQDDARPEPRSRPRHVPDRSCSRSSPCTRRRPRDMHRRRRRRHRSTCAWRGPSISEGSRLAYSIQGIDNSKAEDNGAARLAGRAATPGAKLRRAGRRGRRQERGGHHRFRNHRLDQPEPDAGAVRRRRCLQHHRRQRRGSRTFRPPCPTIRARRGAGLTPGATIDNAFLLAQNPGLTIQQIDNAMIPRLGRPMFDVGDQGSQQRRAQLRVPSDATTCTSSSTHVRQEGKRPRARRHDVGRAPHQPGRPRDSAEHAGRSRELRHRLRGHQRARSPIRSSSSSTGRTSRTRSSGAPTPA